MSFDVNLGFKVTTDGLNEVISNIDKLTAAVGKFNKAEIDSARLSAANAKAAEAKEKANKAAAQALQAEIVLTDKNNDLQDKAAKKAQATAVAQSNVAQATSVSTNALDRQKDVLAYMTEGFSRGQSSTLAYAKASGLAADQLRELGQVLQTQRKLIGGDPFDKSTSGLLSLQTQYKETQVAISQYNAQTGLTKQQTRELSRDYERLTTQMLSQGRSMGDVTSALDQHTQKYIAVATELNRLTTAEKAHERAQRDSSNAIRAVSKEEEKMISIMNSLNNQTNMNASFSEKAAIAEANYARNLRLAGVSADDAAKRLGVYRQQQRLVAAEEQKRQQLYLQRGLQPQIGDVVVSLAGGQNPLTVMLQQGDQIRGLISQTGVQGEALAASMRAAFSGTIESIKMTAGAMLSVFTGAAATIGKSIWGVVTGPFAAFSEAWKKSGQEGAAAGARLSDAFASAFSATNMAMIKSLPGLLGLAAVAMLAIGAAAYSVVKQQDDLTEALIRTGGSLGLSKDAAFDMANSFNAVGVSTSKASEFMAGFAKSGEYTRQELETIIPVANKMKETFGDSVEDIVKSFDKFKKDPVAALIELAKNTGKVSLETIEMVNTMKDAGQITDATALAIKEAARVHSGAADQMKQDYSTLGKILNETGNMFSSFWAGVKGLVYQKGSAGRLADDIGFIQKRIAEQQSYVGGGNKTYIAEMQEQVKLLSKKLLVQKEADDAEAIAMQNRVIQAKTYESWNKREDAAMTNAAKRTREHNKIREEGLILGKSEIEISKMLSDYDAKHADKKTKLSDSQKVENSIRKEAEKALERAKTLLNGETVAQDNLTKARKLELDILDNPRYKEYPEEIKKRIAAVINEADAIEKLNKKRQDEIDIWNKQYKEYVDLQSKKDESWFNQLEKSELLQRSLDEESESLIAQAKLIGLTDEARKREVKTREAQILKAKELRDIESNSKLNTNQKEEESIAAEKRFQQRMLNVNTEIAVDAATKYADEMQKAAEDISEAIATALFEGGDKGAKKLKASLTKMFREKITIAIQGEVKGLMGLPEGTSSISNFLSGNSSLASGGSAISGAGNAISSGASLAGTVASIGTTLTNFGAGLSAGISQFSAGVSTFASVANGAAVGGSTGFGIALGAAGPYIAAALALYAIYKGTQGETRSGGQYGYGQTDTGNYGKLNSQFIQGPSGGQIQGKAVQDAIDSTVSGINGILKKLGSSATLVGFQAALESSEKDRGGVYAGGTLSTGAKFGEAGLGGGRTNYNGTLYETTSANSLDSETAMKNFSTDLIQATLQAIQAAADIPKSISDMLTGVDVEALSQENATALLNSVVAMSEFSAALKTLPFANLQDLSYEASVALSDLIGGLGGLSSALSSYYQNFYSESERQANTLKSVEGAFKSLGITMPDISKGSDSARAEFRKLVDAQDLSTEAGRRNYAALLQLSGTFAELNPLLDDAKNAWKDLTQSILEEVQRIRGVINSGENQSLSGAQSAFDLATTLARAGDKDAAASLPELSKTLLDIAAKQATSLTELRRIQYITAGSLEQTATVIPKFAAGGDYSGGLALVGEKGPELINFSSGGYVANASNTANLLDNNSVLDLLDKVNTNLDGMRYELRSNVTHVAKTAKLLDRVIPDGASIQVTVVNP